MSNLEFQFEILPKHPNVTSNLTMEKLDHPLGYEIDEIKELERHYY